MKKFYQFTLLAIVMGLSVLGSLGAEPNGEVQNVSATVPSVGTMSSDSEGILYMREEEKLARDVYLALYDIWGIRTFSNIAKSEQKHMDAVATLIQAQGLVDPVVGSKPGEFQNPTLAALYMSLVEQGSKSPQDALIVGATIEDLDIHDLETYLAETDDPDSLAVYSNLLRGSENHMQSFSKQLNRYNIAYEARYITDERLAGILSR
ncbi:hypothetical protein SpiGrapes_1971 [Sphaerochaeta pleomorpha str. Grapes]|uniref:DUF2202 domain-containing protein n=1 Tax=Sphaerochaeta pleomorpha (strain ATCC BAA-1885 / DSM 22778 / Grapes) TaxID=158190 RepID=G8QQB3_SPHPG|nr:DUF2202 domain-containing protein [Sphaerochaeta pleomorpha]AEV29758.1 hypothetical protein SpiGrapes_1971 [Sphaerochaeta pleomorpha str. Grapes]